MENRNETSSTVAARCTGDQLMIKRSVLVCVWQYLEKKLYWNQCGDREHDNGNQQRSQLKNLDKIVVVRL